MEIQGEAEPWSIGDLARASGLSVKTIRFYSDAGLLSAARTSAGHRRYAPDDLTRLHVIRSLRALDMDLPTIAAVLSDTGDLQTVLRTHVDALEVRQRAVQRQLAVARAAAASPQRTIERLHALTRIETAERDQLLRRFWDHTLRGVRESDAAWFRSAGMPELPAAPTEDQLDAWLEVADLAADPDFRRSTRASAWWFSEHARDDLDTTAWQRDLARALDLAHHARTQGLNPDTPQSRRAVQAYVIAHATAFDQEPSPAFCRWLSQQLHDLTDPRAQRWWHLIACIQPTPDSPRDPVDIAWLHHALAHAADHPPDAS